MKKLAILLTIALLLTLAGCDSPIEEIEPQPQGEADVLSSLETVDLGCCVTDIGISETVVLGANSVIYVYNDFIMTLNSDRHIYSTADVIRIWGTLEYVGDYDSIEIWHGCPFMIFSISGGDEFDFGMALGGAVIDILASSVLERGIVYHFAYQKSGGWSADDPHAEFWEAFFSEPDLLLPAGEYTIVLSGGFSLSERVLGSESGLRAELNIRVTQ